MPGRVHAWVRLLQMDTETVNGAIGRLSHAENVRLRTERHNASGAVVSGTGGVCHLYWPAHPVRARQRAPASADTRAAPAAVTKLSVAGAVSAGSVYDMTATTATTASRARTGGPGDSSALLENILGWTLVVLLAVFVTQAGLM